MSIWAWIGAGVGAIALWRLFRPQPRIQKKPPTKPLDRFDVAFLAERLSLSVDALESFEPKYTQRLIDKRGPYRSGNPGKRKLNVPEPDTMELQRRILARILRPLKVHPAASGFEKGHSVVHNALPHAYQAVVLKMDIVSFFDTTRAERVLAYFQRIGWTKRAAQILTKLVTHEGGLPQGAPTSPALSNRLNVALDTAIARHARYYCGTYTRYADDITISFPKDYPSAVRSLAQRVRRVAKRYGYQVHKRRKLHVLRRHHSQRVTGLVVNEGPRLPRKTRRWLRAVEHRLKTQGEASLTEQQLAGWRAYEKHVDTVRTEALDREVTAIREELAKEHGDIWSVAHRLSIPHSVAKVRIQRLGLWDPDWKSKKKKKR